MPRYKLYIEYDGSSYCGWQRQKGQNTVQESLEKAIFSFTQEKVSLFTAARTDSGVHAKGQVAHVDLHQTWNEKKLCNAINAHLRLNHDKIAILDTSIVSEDFHARFSAIKRHYIYHILNRPSPTVLDTLRCWWVQKPLNIDAMNMAAKTILGKHDFTTFRSIHCQAKSPIRTLDALYISHTGNELEIYASAQSFLHKQVRSMVGCLKKIGEGSWAPIDLMKALEACDRSACAMLAPPHGLYLTKVDYPDPLIHHANIMQTNQ